MSYDQDGRMMADFDKGECDFLRRHGRTPDEVMAENTKLRAERDHMWALRDTWQENDAKLREENERLRSVVSDGADNARELRAENAKLMELAERAWKTAERLCQAFDGPCRADDVTAYKPCPMGERDEECVYGQLQRELRELGVEVDDG